MNLLYENVLRLCKERNISISKLERDCGFGNGTIRLWKDSSPSVARAKKVAEYFGLTVNDLMANDPV